MFKKLSIIFIVSIMFSPNLANADGDTYIDCLKESFKGNHNFTAEEVRSLCLEISGTQDTHYTFTSKKEMIPSNEFTRCYDREIINLKPLGKKRSIEIAKIICRYEAR